MKLPQIALKNYQFVIILVVLGLFLGISSLMTMPRSEDPNPNFPIYTIIVVYPGTSPEDLEELVVDPIEEAIEEIPDIEKINTEIEDGVVKITVEGAFGINVDDQYDEVVAEVNTIRDRLPADIFSLDFVQFKPQERVYIQQFALVSTEASYSTLNDHAEALEYELEKISGVAQAEVFAAPQEEVRVSLDFQKMARQNIPLSQVIGVLQSNNINIPGGVIKSGQKSFNIKSSGGYKNLDEIKATVISPPGDRIIYLRDIAEVSMDYEDLRWIARYQGDPAVFINLTQEENENVVSLGERINQVAQEYKEQLPSTMQLVTAFEQAPAVEARISGFFVNLLQGVALVGVIILVFLGWRPAIIIMMVIPIAILLAIGALDLSGFALQQISIAALVIALGLLVDNGIVVIENIIRLQKEGLSWKEAAVQGTSEVGYAIISSTVTTLLAFFPLALMQSGPGEFLRSLPVTVILVLIASLLLALTLTPILAGRLMKSPRKPKPRRVDKAVNRWVQKYYRPVLNFALAKPWRILLIAVGIFLGSLMLFPFIGVSFFPTADKPVLLIEVDTPEGSNLEATDQAVSFVEQVLDTTKYVAHYSSNVGHGNPMVYYNRVNEEYAKTHGQLLVNFENWDPDRFYQTLAEFKKTFAQYPLARITFSELKNGPPFEAPIEIKLLGENLDTLKRLAFEVEEIVKSVEGTQNIDNPLAVYKTNLKVDINRDKAGLLGLSLAGIDQSVRASLNGITVDQVTMEDNEEYPIVVRIPFADKPSIDDFNKVYFATNLGGQVPLRQVAKLAFETEVNKISHYNLQRNTAITADLLNPDDVTAITETIIEKLEAVQFPAGYSYHVAGEYEEQQDSFGDLGTLLLLAMIGIFAVLVLQFRSLVQPLVIFSAVPLAITGSFIALFITGWSFSFFAFVGFISLVGIVVNNSIILVDYTNQLRREGMERLEALVKASETRFTPILLTTATTVVGLLPLTLSQTQLWSPLGWTIIGGLLSSTFLTLLVVPALFKWMVR